MEMQADGAAARIELSRRRLLKAGVGGALGLAAIGGGSIATPAAVTVPGYDDPKRWAGRTLRVGAWGGDVQAALREAVWRPFGKATGCTIREVVTDYGMLRASRAARKAYADALVVDPIWAAAATSRLYVQPLDIGTVAPVLLPPLAMSEVAVPAYAYAIVSAFRRDAFAESPPLSWKEWWDKSRFTAPRALQRGALNNFEFARMAQGVSASKLYPLDGKRAISGLAAISGKIVDRWWDSALQPVSWLGTDHAAFSSAWHFRVVAARRRGLPLDFVWNQGILTADQWVVPLGASGHDVAMDFLRYATTPEVQAALARRLPLGPVNPGALPLLDATLLPDLPTTPGNVGLLVPRDAEWWALHREEATELFNNWLLGVPNG